MKRTRLIVIAKLATLIALLPASMAGAARVADGSAETSVTLASVTLNGATINVGAASGHANNLLSAMGAQVALTAAAAHASLATTTVDETRGHTETKCGNAECNNSNAASEVLPLTIEDLVDGQVTYAISTATVDPDPIAPYAFSSIGQSTLNASLGSGFVVLEGVDFGGITNEASVTKSRALQGVDISKIALLPLGELFDRAAGLSVEAAADKIIAFANAYGGSELADELALVETARGDAVDDFNSQITSMNTVLALIPGAPTIDPLSPTTASPQQILDASSDFQSDCSADPAIDAVFDCDVLLTIAQPLLDVLNDLFAELAKLSLMSLTDFQAGVSAEAFDAHSVADSVVSWGTFKVAGITVTTTTFDAAAHYKMLQDEIETAVGLLRGLPGMEGLVVKVVPLATTETSNVKEGDYWIGRSNLSALEIEVFLPASASPASSGGDAMGASAAPGEGMDFKTKVLSLGATARHRPGVIDDPSAGGPGGGGGNPGLAMTGMEIWLPLLGIFVLAVALKLRRWLGDAA